MFIKGKKLYYVYNFLGILPEQRLVSSEGLAFIVTNVDQINWPTVTLSALTLAILIILPRFVSRTPAALVGVALGMANVAGGLIQAYPAGGGTSQTAVNVKAGQAEESMPGR